MAVKDKVPFYPKEVPEMDDIVMVRVLSIDRPDGDAKAGLGAYAELLEYGGMQGLVLLSELSRRRIRSLNRIIKVGDVTAVQVIAVSKERNFVDLSKRRVHLTDAAAHMEYFQMGQRVDSLMRRLVMTLRRRGDDVSLREVYETLVWPLYSLKKSEEDEEPWFSHALLGLEHFARHPEFADRLGGKEGHKEELLKMLQSQLRQTTVRVRADVEVNCFAYEGVEALRRALRAGEEATKALKAPARVRLIAAPLYMIQAESFSRKDGFESVNVAINAIRDAITPAGGNLKVVTEPRTAHLDDSHAEEEDEEEGDGEGAAKGGGSEE